MILRLVSSNSTFHAFKASCILRNSNIFKRNIGNLVKKESTKVTRNENLFLKRTLTLNVGLMGLGASLYIKYNVATIQCEANRTNELQIAANEVKFDWIRFWRYLKGHIWKLIGAIVAALAVAYLNISIPSLLGELINALSKYSGPGYDSSSSFFQVSKTFHFYHIENLLSDHFRMLKIQHHVFCSLTWLNLLSHSSTFSYYQELGNKWHVKYDEIYSRKF